MKPYFSHDKVFPIIADLIRKRYQKDREFVTHAEIVEGLLIDRNGKKLVEEAYQEKKRRTPNDWWSRKDFASNMVQWFSARIERAKKGKTQYRYHLEFEGKKIEQNWAFRPRRAIKRTKS